MTIHTRSHVDTSVSYTDHQAVVSLVSVEGGLSCLGRHGEIVVEMVEHKAAVFKIVHLTGTGSSRELLSGVGVAPGHICCGPSTPFSSKGEVEIRSITTIAKAITKIKERAGSWVVDRDKAVALIKCAEEKRESGDTHFSLFGHHQVIDRIKQLMGFPPSYNCISFALEMLTIAGVHIKVEGGGLNIITRTEDHVHRSVRATALKIDHLCLFAKNGQVSAIRCNFPCSSSDDGEAIDIDLIVSGVTAGPVETYLGQYNALALATAYGQFDTVKVLIEEYKADPMIRSGRNSDHTALDCAQRNFWFAPVKPTVREKMIEYLQSHGSSHL